jgi:hypothetical protein
VSLFLRAAALVMLAMHMRSLDKDFVGISELEYALINTDFVESGFAHLDRATRNLFGRAGTRQLVWRTLGCSAFFLSQRWL